MRVVFLKLILRRIFYISFVWAKKKKNQFLGFGVEESGKEEKTGIVAYLWCEGALLLTFEGIPVIISSFHFQNSCRSRRPLALYKKKECLSRLLSVFPLQHDGMHDFLIICFFWLLFGHPFCCFCFNLFLPPIVRALYVTLGRSSGRDDEESSTADWMVDPLRLSQLKEQYRRDRAKNRRGLVARKFPPALNRRDEVRETWRPLLSLRIFIACPLSFQGPARCGHFPKQLIT